MKPLLFLTAALFAAVVGFGQKSAASKTVRLPESVRTLSVESKMTIVLTDDASSDIRIVGAADNLSVRSNDGELSLAQVSESYLPELTVYVPAASLHKIRLNADVKLSSAAVLANQYLRIVMASESSVNIRSKGRVDVQGDDGFSVKLLK